MKLLGVGNGNSLQDACLADPMDRGTRRAGTWWTTVHKVKGLDMTEQLSILHSYMCQALSNKM